MPTNRQGFDKVFREILGRHFGLVGLIKKSKSSNLRFATTKFSVLLLVAEKCILTALYFDFIW